VPRRKGISPVIATVIIVAVTIAVAIAVAFWMTGIVGLFTAAEKLEIVSLYAQQDQGGWIVTITVRNTGTTPTSIDEIFINGIPIGRCQNVQLQSPDGAAIDLQKNAIRLNPGAQVDFQINIDQNAQCGTSEFRAGSSIEVKLHSTGGKEYPKLTVLP
jgi:flagellin-like protein